VSTSADTTKEIISDQPENLILKVNNITLLGLAKADDQ
jgi:hypothetical protein